MSAKALPFGVYIHIPFCKSKCKYCAFASVTDLSLQTEYVKTLVGEIASAPERGGDVDTVYIGGGTPSCLYEGAVECIVRAVKNVFNVFPSAEITVECNPESVTEKFVAEIADVGVNRVSLGLQSANDGILKAIGRLHDFSDFRRAVNVLSARVENISSDLMVGLPDQTAADVAFSVRAASERCSHVSVYALTAERDAPLFKNYMPDDDVTADLYDTACAELAELGFTRYEVSNFARDGRESAHNKKYWACMPYIGFGAAAHGYDGGYTRYFHTDDVRGYIADPARQCYALTDKDRYNEYIMLRLRTAAGIDKCAFKARFGRDLDCDNAALGELIEQGLIENTGSAYRIPARYAFVMNGIIERLMLD